MTGESADRMTAGRVVALDNLVKRYIAPNAGMMTGPGTNCYWLGPEALLLIDPGPAMPQHVDALVEYAGDRLRGILVTHTHRDHSPAAKAVAARTGAPIFGMLPPATPENDQFFSPDNILTDNQRISLADLTVRVIHTPGHASNHVCFLLEDNAMLFTGDHIMNGSTVVIAAPDGNMREYLDSLVKLKSYAVETIAPGHGELLRDPDAVVDWIVAHRLEREAKLVQRLKALQPCDTDTLLASVYDEVDPRLLPVAKYSLLAHLGKLEEERNVCLVDDHWRIV